MALPRHRTNGPCSASSLALRFSKLRRSSSLSGWRIRAAVADGTNPRQGAAGSLQQRGGQSAGSRTLASARTLRWACDACSTERRQQLVWRTCPHVIITAGSWPSGPGVAPAAWALRSTSPRHTAQHGTAPSGFDGDESGGQGLPEAVVHRPCAEANLGRSLSFARTAPASQLQRRNSSARASSQPLSTLQ